MVTTPHIYGKRQIKGGVKMQILKEIMYEERITQYEVASVLGINQQTVSGLLGRGEKMSTGRFLEICKAMGCEVVIKRGNREWKI